MIAHGRKNALFCDLCKKLQGVFIIRSASVAIPKKKHRSNTAILETLASTVNKLTEKPQHQYIDDPYLIPTSLGEKRIFSLSKISGQRAARWFVEQNPKLFLCNQFAPNEPNVPAFDPPVFYEHPYRLEGLRERIDKHRSVAALKSYQMLKEEEVHVPDEDKKNLFQLLCIFNGNDRPPTKFPEEVYLDRDIINDDSTGVELKWKRHGAADQLFTELESKDSEVYSALIRGRAKYNDLEYAMELYEEAKQQNIQLPVQCFNDLILGLDSRSTKYMVEKKWENIKFFMREMVKAKVHPDLMTFQNALKVISSYKNVHETKKWLLQIIKEMKELKIVPSLACWKFCIVSIVSASQAENSDLGKSSTFIYEVMKEIENQPLEYNSNEDYELFPQLMAKNFYFNQDLDLAYRINRLLNTNKNSLLLGGLMNESIYYTNFLRLLCTFEQVDTLMNEYSKIVPYAYIPSNMCCKDILQAIDLNEGYQYLPLLWSNMLQADAVRNPDLMEALFAMMAKDIHAHELNERFCVAARYLLEITVNADERRHIRNLPLTGPLVGYITQIFLNGQEEDNAWKAHQTYRKMMHRIEGFPGEQGLIQLFERQLECNELHNSVIVLMSLSDGGYSSVDICAGKLLKLDLPADLRKQVEDIF